MGCFQAEPSKDSESLRFAKQQRMGEKNKPKDGEWFLRSHFWPIKPHLSSLALLTHLLPYGTLVLFRGEMRHGGSGPLHPSCGDSCSMKQLHQHKWLFIGTLLIIVFLGSESCSNDRESKTDDYRKCQQSFPPTAVQHFICSSSSSRSYARAWASSTLTPAGLRHAAVKRSS